MRTIQGMFACWLGLWLATCAVVYGIDRKSEEMRRSARMKEMLVLQSTGMYSEDALGRPTLTYFHADGTRNTVPWLRGHKYATHVFVFEGPEGRYRVSVWNEGPTTIKRLVAP